MDAKHAANLSYQATRYLPEIADFDWSQSIEESIAYLKSGGIKANSQHAEKYAVKASNDPVLIAFYAMFPKISAGVFQGVDLYRAMKYFERLRELANQKERVMVLASIFEDDRKSKPDNGGLPAWQK